MNVLVTGSNGFIGRHVIRRLRLELGFQCAGLDKTYRETVSGLHYAVDLLDEFSLRTALDDYLPDAIIHLAAMASVRDGMVNPNWYLSNNIIGTANLLKNMSLSVKTFVFAASGGTAYGYAPVSDLPIPVSHKTEPEDVYGISKLACENLVRVFCEQNKTKWFNLRFPNVYGPGQNPFGEAGVVAIFANKMLDGEVPTINGDGGQTRDYAFVGDVAYHVANRATQIYKDQAGVTWNVGTGIETSVNDIAAKLATLTGYKGIIKHGPAKVGEVHRVSLQPNLKCNTSIDDGLKATVDAFIAERDQDD